MASHKKHEITYDVLMRRSTARLIDDVRLVILRRHRAPVQEDKMQIRQSEMVSSCQEQTLQYLVYYKSNTLRGATTIHILPTHGHMVNDSIPK